MTKSERNTPEIRERFLRRCAKGRPWLHWAYWMFGGKVQAQHPDFAKEPTIKLLSELLRNGDIVAGVPKGYFGFESWDLSPEESIERIRREWDSLDRPPNHADVAAFTLPEARRARYRREHPESAEELERIDWKADLYLRVLFDEIDDAREVLAEDWDEMDEIARDMYAYNWDMLYIDNDLLALESWHRKGLLTTEQEERYRLLKEEFRKALPVLEKLDVHVSEEILGS